MLVLLQQIYESLLDTLNVLTGEVLIALSPTIGKGNRHGVVHLKCVKGGIVHTSFKVDNPDKLINPTFLAIRSLFNQITKMGYVAEFIEIKVGNKTVVYKRDTLLPVYTCKTK